MCYHNHQFRNYRIRVVALEGIVTYQNTVTSFNFTMHNIDCLVIGLTRLFVGLAPLSLSL